MLDALLKDYLEDHPTGQLSVLIAEINPVVAQQYGSTVLGMWVSHVRQTAARRGCV